MCNRKGSVIVDFSLWVDVGITDKDLLRNTLLNENNFKIGGYNVDHKSIRLSGKFHLFVSIKTILVQVFNVTSRTNITPPLFFVADIYS